MGTLYAYSLDGVQLWSASNASLENAGAEWLGNGYFMINGPNNTTLWRLEGTSIFQISAPRKNTGTVDGIGCFVMPFFDDGLVPEKDGFRGMHIYVIDHDSALISPTTATIRSTLFDGVNMREMWNDAVHNSTNHCSACSDGIYVYTWRTSSSIPNVIQFRKYLVDRGQFFTIANVNTSYTNIKDMCFNGINLWVVDDQNDVLREFTVDFIETGNSFSIPNGCAGVMCNDNTFYVIGA